jgi:hypothetical protein
LGELHGAHLADAPRLHDLRARAVGPDILLRAETRELP